MRWLLEKLVAWGARSASLEDLPHTRVIPDYMDGEPYLTRVVFPRIFGVRPLLHRFHRGDGDRALHNHPWTWSLSIILRGSYTEERLEGHVNMAGKQVAITKERRVRWFNWLTHKDFHRVATLHGDVWTLFLSGPRRQDWGFLENGETTPHETYIARVRKEHGL